MVLSSPITVLPIFAIVLSSWACLLTHGYMIGNNPYHRAEYLDTQGMYYLEWKVDQLKNLITFNITGGTTGYMLFGLTNNKSAGGADIIVAGVMSSGQSYFSDRYTVGDAPPQEDITSTTDYKLHSAKENRTHTTLSFSRSLDTCDPFDYPITENKVTVLWGYGVTDDYEVVRSYGVQGSSDLHLLDPEYSPRISRDRRFNGAPTVVTRENLQVWTIHKQIMIPNNHTSYICSIHKAPQLQRKHHMVGFDVYFHSQGSRQRVHHLLVRKCNAPGRGDPRPLFEPYEGGQEQTCYQRVATDGPMPVHFCDELAMVWAVGARSFFTPPDIGFAFAEQVHEYYMVQVHYDNPDKQSGVMVDMRLDFFYTSNLRPYDGGVMGTGTDIFGLPPSILLPPQTTTQRTFSHCPAGCTKRMLPPSGIKIFAAHLHSHHSGRRLRLRQFSENVELPWILNDDNYDSSFQQTRHLKEEVRLLPGDHLTMECIYDNTWTNGTVAAGFSTKQETCFSFLYYYTRINDYSFCESRIVSEEYRRRFLGVSNITWSQDKLEWVVITPPNLDGLTISEVSDNHVTWDSEKRQGLMRFHEAHPQVSTCSRTLSYRDPVEIQQLLDSGVLKVTGSPLTRLNTPNDYVGPAQYHFKARPYVPEQSCSYHKLMES